MRRARAGARRALALRPPRRRPLARATERTRRAVGPAPQARRAAVGAAHRRARADRAARGHGARARHASRSSGAVPIAEVEVETSVERPGRSVELLAGELRPAGGRCCARAPGACSARPSAPVRAAAAAAAGRRDAAPAAARRDVRLRARDRVALGARRLGASAGPATVWTRLRIPVVEGEEPTPRQRVHGRRRLRQRRLQRARLGPLPLHQHRADGALHARAASASGCCLDARRRSPRAAPGSPRSVLSDASGRSRAARRRCSSRRADRRGSRVSASASASVWPSASAWASAAGRRARRRPRPARRARAHGRRRSAPRGRSSAAPGGGCRGR